MEVGGASLSSLVARYERYTASGEINSTVADVATATARVERAFADRPGIVMDRIDGLTVSNDADPERDSGDGIWWFNLRPSNTEPLLRLNAEAANPTTMAKIRDEVLSLVRADR